MPNATHTKKPWHIEKALGGTNLIIQGAEYSGKIAVVMPNKNSQEVNARLIAAAPDLLDTLKMVAEFLEKRDLVLRTRVNALKTLNELIDESIAKVEEQKERSLGG